MDPSSWLTCLANSVELMDILPFRELHSNIGLWWPSVDHACVAFGWSHRSWSSLLMMMVLELHPWMFLKEELGITVEGFLVWMDQHESTYLSRSLRRNFVGVLLELTIDSTLLKKTHVLSSHCVQVLPLECTGILISRLIPFLEKTRYQIIKDFQHCHGLSYCEGPCGIMTWTRACTHRLPLLLLLLLSNLCFSTACLLKLGDKELRLRSSYRMLLVKTSLDKVFSSGLLSPDRPPRSKNTSSAKGLRFYFVLTIAGLLLFACNVNLINLYHRC